MADAPVAHDHGPQEAGCDFTVTEHLWIPMPDGVRLAARLWLPDGATQHPVPALLEYIPYRKADMVRARDERNHPFFAAHGYACLRVDMRGSGDSEGLMDDMYSEHELSDACHVIDWIAAQRWCNARIGMFGTSWGGTAALQANVDAPEALKAVIAVCATHDRYEDDIHHMGGCLLTDTFEWGATLPAILGAPPTPNAGPDWKARWQERLEALSFPVQTWVREEARGAYWRHGSVIHEADRLTRPVLAVGGWSDRYSNSVMSLLSARPDLVWGVVGPWGHHYPDHGDPGPAIGFQQLALEWWNHWLKADEEEPTWPRLRVWLREFDPPEDVIGQRNGQWIETGPPTAHTIARTWHLVDGALSDAALPGEGWDIPTDLCVGRVAGDTGYFGRYGGQPLDQREDDALSLCFDTAPLREDLALFGEAAVRLTVNANSPLRQLSLRLNDIAPDGTSARVVICLRNLALDDGLDAPAEQPQPVEQEITARFHTNAYLFRKGHRIRLSLASSYWPMVWPSPGLGALRIETGELVIPVFEGSPTPLARALPPALDLPERKTHRVLQAPGIRRVQHVQADGRLVSGWEQPFSEVYYVDTKTSFGSETNAEHRIEPGDPASAQTTFEHRAVYRRPDGVATLHSKVTARCDDGSYSITGRLTADWDNQRVVVRDWDVTVPRRYG